MDLSLKMPAGQDGPAAESPSSGPSAPVAAPERIVLTGFMGSGKTTVGRLLADRLCWQFLDLDGEIERRAGRSVPAIFAESGEPHFRQLEAEALATSLGQQHVVVGLGGGATQHLGNRLLLEQTPQTAVVYLCAPLSTLLTRCGKDAADPEVTGRPLLIEAETRFRQRQPHYERLSHLTVHTAALAPEEVASTILRALVPLERF